MSHQTERVERHLDQIQPPIDGKVVEGFDVPHHRFEARSAPDQVVGQRVEDMGVVRGG